MKIEYYDGIPVTIPRAGLESYANPARRIILAVVDQERARMRGHGEITSIRINRVEKESDAAEVRVYYETSWSR